MADTPPIVGSSGLDIDAATTYLVAHAAVHSTRRCAHAVRSALLAGGVSFATFPEDAKAYGPYLLAKGFIVIPPTRYVPKKGDVVVIQSYVGGSTAGHITMFSGTGWYSDFVQTDMWSGPGYRTNQPDYVIYRP